MRSFKLVLYPDEVLRKPSQEIKTIDERLHGLIKAMAEIMYTNNGIGLAAPQVGYLSRVIVADVGDGLLTLINPEIISKDGDDFKEEGCLSLPGISVGINRPIKIKVKAIRPDEKEVVLNLEGLKARVVQHEIDHLNGRLIIDYASTLQRLQFKEQLEKLEKQYPFNLI